MPARFSVWACSYVPCLCISSQTQPALLSCRDWSHCIWSVYALDVRADACKWSNVISCWFLEALTHRWKKKNEVYKELFNSLLSNKTPEKQGNVNKTIFMETYNLEIYQSTLIFIWSFCCSTWAELALPLSEVIKPEHDDWLLITLQGYRCRLNNHLC